MNGLPNVAAIMERATQNMQATMQAGARLQQEATRWWTDMLQEAESYQSIQRRAQRMMNEFIPSAQKNAVQYFTMMNHNYRRFMDLWREMLEAGRSKSIGEAQTRMIELWEASLGAWRMGANEMAQINKAMAESMMEMADRGGELQNETMAAMRQTARTAQQRAGAAAETMRQTAQEATHSAAKQQQQAGAAIHQGAKQAGAGTRRRTAAGGRHTARAAHARRGKKK